MSSTPSQATLRTAGLGLLAMAIGSSVSPPASSGVQAARVSCTVTSDSSTNIETQDGFVEALVNMAEYVCGEDEAQVVPIEERITGVASAMAEAVAEVLATCTGEGDSMASVAGFARAETRAEAVGRASARILTTSEVCRGCTGALDALTATVANVSATAVAEASVSATFEFEEGDAQTVTAADVQRTVEENIIELLSTVTGQVRTSAADGCSVTGLARSEAGGNFAECDVAISADDIIESTDAVADAGAAVRAIACEGEGSTAEVRVIAREIAMATAQAIVQADAFCESSGGPGTIACGLTNGTMTAVASAQASAFADGLAMTMGAGCDCDLSTNISATQMEEIIAEASSAALARACVEGEGIAMESDFQIAIEDAMGVAVAEVIGSAVNGGDCRVSASACAETGKCVERFEECSGPGVDGMHACCDPDDVCTSVLGSPAFRCESRALVSNMPGAEMLECNP